MRSSTETIIKALRILASDIQSEDGVANSAIREAADRLEELEKSELFLKECIDVAIKDREYYESESKSRLEGLLGATEANRVSLGRIAELEQQISALQAKRQPLSDAEINQIIIDEQIPVKTGNTAKKFARAIEKAHGIV